MIPMSYAKRYSTIGPELRLVARLGHSVPLLDVSGKRGQIVAKGKCVECGGTLVIERDRTSTEADALIVSGDVLAMECC